MERPKNIIKMIDKRPNHFRIRYQIEFKEAKANKKITNGARKNKGVIRKFQVKKRKVGRPVKLLK
jgi:hypothetical protein